MTQVPPTGGSPDSTTSGSGSVTETSVNLQPVPVDYDASVVVSFTPDEVALIKALPEGSAMLFVKQGPGSGSRFLLSTERVTIGRGDSADIFLDDVTVSRHHAEFVKAGTGYAVHDLGSLNGTYVNRALVDTCALNNGDLVQVGKFRLLYVTTSHGTSEQ